MIAKDKLKVFTGLLRDATGFALYQLHAEILNEMKRRAMDPDHPTKSPLKGEFADCEPKTKG